MEYENRVAKVAPDHLLTNIDGYSISAEQLSQQLSLFLVHHKPYVPYIKRPVLVKLFLGTLQAVFPLRFFPGSLQALCPCRFFSSRERVLYWQPNGPNPLYHRDD